MSITDEILDLAIIGGGITGITAAYLFSDTKLKVELFERHKLMKGETSHTSAMLSYQFDTSLEELKNSVGLDTAKELWSDGKQALDFISSFVKSENVECDFEICPSYSYPSLEEDIRCIFEEHELIKQIGYESEIVSNFHSEWRLNTSQKIALKLPNQAKFSPIPYLEKLVEKSKQKGFKYHEDTNIEEITKDGETFVLRSGDKHIRARNIFVATHFPFTASALYSSNFKEYNTYCIYAEIPKGLLEHAVYWDSEDPYHYWRVDKYNNEKDGLLIGGYDHQTGHLPENIEPKQGLETYVKETLGIKDAKVIDFWDGQVVDSLDLIPVIGEYEQNHYIATGFRGNGLTFGTFSAIKIFEKIAQNKDFPKIYSPQRKFPTLKFLKTGLNEGTSFGTDLVKGLLNNNVRKGEGKIIRNSTKLVGVYKDEEGKEHRINPYCSHMKCIVRWNKISKSWDCPCHGSRFDKDGKVMTGPAKGDLNK